MPREENEKLTWYEAAAYIGTSIHQAKFFLPHLILYRRFIDIIRKCRRDADLIVSGMNPGAHGIRTKIVKRKKLYDGVKHLIVFQQLLDGPLPVIYHKMECLRARD